MARNGRTMKVENVEVNLVDYLDFLLENEKKVYDALKQRARIGFLTLKRANMLHRSIIKCQSLITPLRQACSGGESMAKPIAAATDSASASASSSASSARRWTSGSHEPPFLLAASESVESRSVGPELARAIPWPASHVFFPPAIASSPST